jgi:chorismate mutase
MSIEQLQLTSIAQKLESLEETIVYKLIDRAQFCVNAVAYRPGESGFLGEPDSSLFELRIRYQEEIDARFGRFCVPEERPFSKNLPAPRRVVLLPDTGLHVGDYDCINLSADILSGYRSLLAQVCKEGDDGNYGSSVEHDVYALQAIARRIHYGSLYVAESKFRSAPDIYTKLIVNGDAVALEQLLTRKEVEDAILMRVRSKVAYAQGQVNTAIRTIIDPELVLSFYRDCIIPLTKKGEVRYLLNRSLPS